MEVNSAINLNQPASDSPPEPRAPTPVSSKQRNQSSSGLLTCRTARCFLCVVSTVESVVLRSTSNRKWIQGLEHVGSNLCVQNFPFFWYIHHCPVNLVSIRYMGMLICSEFHTVLPFKPFLLPHHFKSRLPTLGQTQTLSLSLFNLVTQIFH